jgi:glutaredoxin
MILCLNRDSRLKNHFLASKIFLRGQSFIKTGELKMIKVYGADWCGDTKQTLKFLDSSGVDYQYINVEQNEEAADWVKNQNNGKERKPTIKVGEKVLSVPSKSELQSALKAEGLIS